MPLAGMLRALLLMDSTAFGCDCNWLLDLPARAIAVIGSVLVQGKRVELLSASRSWQLEHWLPGHKWKSTRGSPWATAAWENLPLSAEHFLLAAEHLPICRLNLLGVVDLPYPPDVLDRVVDMVGDTLTELTIRATASNEEVYAHFVSRCTALQTVDISFVACSAEEQFEAALPSTLRKLVVHRQSSKPCRLRLLLPELRELRVFNALSKDSWTHLLQGSPQLRRLEWMTEGVAGEEVAEALQHAPQLLELRLWNYSVSLPSPCAVRIVQAMPKLKALSGNAIALSDDVLRAVADGCPALQTFVSRYHAGVTFEAGLHMLDSCSQLSALRFPPPATAAMTALVCAALEKMDMNQLQLQQFLCFNAHNLTDAALEVLRGNALIGGIRDMVIDENQLTDAGCATLAAAAAELKTLSLYGSLQITPVGVRAILAGCPKLEQMNIAACPLIPQASDSLVELQQEFSQVQLHSLERAPWKAMVGWTCGEYVC
eukprot:PLAT3690.2.p1 GENE.PLAT3690.2~~PLAT3690.2.p1  ORF type:complete len:487 (+),score=120.04 PLAT3690.2:1-1461(+)